MTIAEVCVNVTANSVQQNFVYLVPERLKFLSAGWRVFVPFGAQRLDGFVMDVREVDDSTEFPFVLKEIFDAIDDESWFTPEMMSAARWLAEFYLCPLSMTMGLFMPGRRGKKISVLFERILKPAKIFDEKNFKKNSAQLKVLKLLAASGELKLSEQKIPSKTIKELVEAGYVTIEQRRILRDSYNVGTRNWELGTRN